MVCLSDEEGITIPIKDNIGKSHTKKTSIQVLPTKSIDVLFVEIASEFHYPPELLKLLIENSKTGVAIDLSPHKDKTLEEVGVNFDQTARNVLVIGSSDSKNSTHNKYVINDLHGDDESYQGTSSNAEEVSNSTSDPPPASMSVDFHCRPSRSPVSKMDIKPVLDVAYVGLVNQAMTCYLNSLLQALYMTPEFRNALYKWEFDGQNEVKSIPFQLQKLFLNLQTSAKSAVETTELTKSFGWDLSEAWQQHDIQELCRVMFDALEQKFKDTSQANLINDLYEGKMLDYVRCLECGTEKSREDTFLDIPLPVRPFGSNVAYNSIEEALSAFVLPETLDGNNQYFCEQCNKKCDAHKGLKFIKFPYLLTLHLKRFDFDYSTMHRIKLNDKVMFPEILNLNCFIADSTDISTESVNNEERETVVRCDDSSTTDSGSALDDESCQVVDIATTVNGKEEDCQEDDEGIDVSLGNNHEIEKNRRNEQKGPFIYELFSIMIHSGSATGGHYYAYIKDFQMEQWFCFNDQSVTRITEDDIRKTYGGGPQRSYYSGAYSSSTNAYMLMYRQIDKQRNCSAMAADEFPPHITKLLQQMREREEYDRVAKEKESDMSHLKTYCYHPVQNQLADTKILVFLDTPVAEIVKDVYDRLKLEGVVALEDCRLVSYNKSQDVIDCSFEGTDLCYCDIKSQVNRHNDWMLEIRQPGIEWQTYKPGGVNMKVFLINLETEEVDGPTSVRVNAGETVREFKDRLAKMLNMDVNTIELVQETYSNQPHYLEEDDVPMKFDSSCSGYKIYVSNALDEDPDKPFIISKLHSVIDRFVHIITVDVVLPDTDISTLESLSIPPLDLNQNLDRLDAGDAGSPNQRISPQPGVVSEGFGDQSNSEDSSLSDSDRTLVGDAPGDCNYLLASNSNSPADQHMASPSDPAEDTYNHDVFGNPHEEMNWDDEELPADHAQRSVNYYFRANQMSHVNSDVYVDTDSSRCCRVLVDKRMNLAKLKKNLEALVGVPVEYFKVYRQYPNQDVEWAKLSDTLNSTKDGERLVVKLGRVLRKDEFSGKVYHFTPENAEYFMLLFDWVIAKGQTVAQVKREILFAAKKQHMLDISFNKCRLRKKNWRNPCKIYLDEQKFVDDLAINNNWEIFLQDLGDVEKMTSVNQLGLFVKRWCPSTLSLTPFHEIILDAPTMEELKKAVSDESGIPTEFVDVCHPKGTFPCDMNVLDIHNELDWNINVPLLESWPLQIYEDGCVFFYRDSREGLKELTVEEKKEIGQRENTRLGRFSTKSYSPRRERALKIYLDTSPNKSEEASGD